MGDLFEYSHSGSASSKPVYLVLLSLPVFVGLAIPCQQFQLLLRDIFLHAHMYDDLTLKVDLGWY